MPTIPDVPRTREQLTDTLVRLCDWFESQAGRSVMLHKGKRGYLGQIAQSQIDKVHCALVALLDGWPDQIVIDLTHHKYPLNAHCDVMDVVRQIEKRRGLLEGGLEPRVSIRDASYLQSEEYTVILEARDAKLAQEFVSRQSEPLNSLTTAFASLGL